MTADDSNLTYATAAAAATTEFNDNIIETKKKNTISYPVQINEIANFYYMSITSRVYTRPRHVKRSKIKVYRTI